MAEAPTGTVPAAIRRIDHIAIAVRDLRRAAHLFVDVLGGSFLAGGEDPRLGITTIQLRFPSGSKLELMAPARSDASLHGFLDARGEGFHHAAVFVEDLRAAVDSLEEEGYEVVDVAYARPDWHEAYLRPRSAFGALLQIVETSRDWSDIRTDVTLDQVLDGLVVWDEDAIPRLKDRGAAATTDEETT